jgi:outer membrane protein OmpA-like peptidoglycan-associated protein
MKLPALAFLMAFAALAAPAGALAPVPPDCPASGVPLPQIHFGAGNSVLDAVQIDTLNAWARLIQSPACGLAMVFVQGHDDTDRPPDESRRLSLQRAQSVANVLMRAGIAQKSIMLVPPGQDPAQPGADPATMRRVDIGIANDGIY